MRKDELWRLYARADKNLPKACEDKEMGRARKARMKRKALRASLAPPRAMILSGGLQDAIEDMQILRQASTLSQLPRQSAHGGCWRYCAASSASPRGRKRNWTICNDFCAVIDQLYARTRCQKGAQRRIDVEDHAKMHAAANLIVAMGIGAVAFVLALGLINMLRGGSPNLSQKLMRWRVGVQFAVIIIIMGVLWFAGKHGWKAPW